MTFERDQPEYCKRKVSGVQTNDQSFPFGHTVKECMSHAVMWQPVSGSCGTWNLACVCSDTRCVKLHRVALYS